MNQNKIIDFTVNADDLDNFFCIPKEDNPYWEGSKTPFCTPIGKTKAYCIRCQSIQEFTVMFFDRDYSLSYVCNGKPKHGFGCYWMYIATLDKIQTQDMRNNWKPQPRRTIYDINKKDD